MTLATLERNDHLRSGSIQKVCILRRKKCCTFAPLEQNVHFRRKRPQKLQKSSSFTVGKKSDARHSRTEWPFTVPIGTKGMCFTMENVLHLRPSRAKRPLSTPTTPEIVVLHERDERFFLNVRPSRTKHHFLARSRSNTAKLVFYTRGRKVFCTTFRNTQYYRRECIKRGPKGKSYAHYLAAPRPILGPEKSILHR